MGGTLLEKQERANKSSNGTKSLRKKTVDEIQNKMERFGLKTHGVT